MGPYPPAGTNAVDTSAPRSEHLGSFQRLCRLWEQRNHFSLILAVVDHTGYRDALIEQLNAVRLGHRLKLAPDDPPLVWLTGVQSACAKRPAALHVFLPLDSPRTQIWWQQANLLRERLADAATLPQIVWLTHADVEVAAHQAPDLWNWREAVLDFTVGLTQAPALTAEAARRTELPLNADAAPSLQRLQQIEAFLADSSTRQPEPDPLLVATLKAEAAAGHLLYGVAEHSLAEANEAAKLFLQQGDPLRAAKVLQVAAHALAILGQLQSAIDLLNHEVLPVIDVDGDRRSQAGVRLTLADQLIERGQPGDADAALGLYERSLQICEDLLRDNPGSAQAARDVSVSLEKLADFRLGRGQPGDADAALGLYERSLQICEDLLRDNPGSVQAARDVSVSLDRLADFRLGRGQPGDADAALGLYERSLQVREGLLRDNPGSAQAARDFGISLERLAKCGVASDDPVTRAQGLQRQLQAVDLYRQLAERQAGQYAVLRTLAVGLFLGAQYAHALGQHETVEALLNELVQLLGSWLQQGGELDPAMAGLLAQLTGSARAGGD
jgi:hypothetical protein